MSERIGRLVRVGIDTGHYEGNDLGPIFEDGRFEYIPVRSWAIDANAEKYCQHKCRKINIEFGNYWSNFLKSSLSDKTFHHDPMFHGGWTYGDCPSDPKNRHPHCRPSTKMIALANLKNDDLLVFTAGLRKWRCCKDKLERVDNQKHQIYIIGYFKVAAVIPFYDSSKRELANSLSQEFKDQLATNAHYVENERCPNEKYLACSVVVIAQKPPASRLLSRAVQISSATREGDWVVGKNVRNFDGKRRNWRSILGFSGSIKMSHPTKIKSSNVERLERELQRLEHA